MAYDALDYRGKSSQAERSSWTSGAACSSARSHAAPLPHVSVVNTPVISVSGSGLPARSAGGSSRGVGACHVETPAARRGAATEVCQKQRTDDGLDRGRFPRRVPAKTECAWLSRVPKAACSKFTLTMSLIACANRNSPRPTIFLSLLDSGVSEL